MSKRISSVLGVMGMLSGSVAYAALGSSVNLAVGTFPIAVATADLGNGHQDVVVANYGSNNVSVLLGNGSGGFAAAVNYAVGTNPHSITIADVNGDGNKDLIVANAGSNTVSVLFGNGSGAFAPAVNYAANTMPYSVDVGNFNGGRKDLAVVNQFSGVSLVPGKNPAGTFGAPVQVFSADAATVRPTSLVVADFDGDGNKDIALANALGGASGVIILRGKGDGTFKAPVNIAVGPRPFSIMADDLDGDGNIDIAVTDYSGAVYVLFGKTSPKGTFKAAQMYAVGSVPTSVASGDTTHHMLKDLIVANSFSGTVSLLMQISGQMFLPAVNTLIGSMSLPSAVATADFNGDHKADAAVANYYSNTVSILFGN